ncbi:MAG: glycosyltransferase [Candidatus Omnitrophota bacterium]
MDKKILILYASAGSGHKKAAEAIGHAFAANASVQMFDIVDFMPPLAKTLYTKGYILLISRLSWLWGLLYDFSDAPCFGLVNADFRKFTNAFTCRRLLAFLLKERPDVVISTQFLASEIVSLAKEKHGLAAKLITVITDFGVHNFWLSGGTDIYCCASMATKEILLKKGIAEDRIRVTGIPVDDKFLKALDKQELSSEFGTKTDQPTLLIATGGIGVGPIEEMVELLKDQAQLLVVCGTNKNLTQKLQQKNHPNVKVFGFVDYMQKLMCLSDIIITKAGGLTVSECLTMGLPMIFFFLIPGQEMINAKTMEAERAGLIARSTDEINDLTRKLIANKTLLTLYQQNSRSLARPRSAAEIAGLA